jgi:hypothetical protein
VVAEDAFLMIRTAIIAAAGAALVAGLYLIGYKAGSNSVQVKWEAAKVAHAEAVAAQEARHRATERKWGDALAQIIDAERAAQEATRHELESIIADRESGALVLRDRFRGCQRELSQTAGTTAVDDGASQAGLSPADERFLVQIAAEADRLAVRLASCQGYVRSVR